MAGIGADLSGTRTLIIDDNAFSRRLLRAMFRQIGITDIVEAADGKTGLLAARSASVDLVILDWIMPQMSGAETLRRLMAQARTSPTGPVLVTSTLACRDAIVAAARLGAAGFIVTPFATTTLRARIERVLATAATSKTAAIRRRRA